MTTAIWTLWTLLVIFALGFVIVAALIVYAFIQIERHKDEGRHELVSAENTARAGQGEGSTGERCPCLSENCRGSGYPARDEPTGIWGSSEKAYRANGGGL